MEHVAAGRGVSIIPLSVANFCQRPDVAAVPVNDLAINKVCLAWIASRRSRLVYDFADVAADIDWRWSPVAGSGRPAQAPASVRPPRRHA
ncbi:hypothetical protein E1218_01895 [Kribbella turkmenica]|uniref:LysR substrate-binding domain-containing protein n=1 Tax=Kribbella turkmenica TaxID=2530375 RepID=A0A4R4XHS1_9ACTN|nr:hypothetical protein [Kribbella turkmenica]TDD30334.1 hypothetical protein E1218_01895 [Kribbella turkmenica]